MKISWGIKANAPVLVWVTSVLSASLVPRPSGQAWEQGYLPANFMYQTTTLPQPQTGESTKYVGIEIRVSILLKAS